MALLKNRGRCPNPGELAVVVGAGRSGIAAAKVLRKHGIKTRLLDNNKNALTKEKLNELKDIEICLGSHSSKQFANAAFVIPSPGIPVSSIEQYIDQSSRPEIISEMELAWRYLDNEPVLAVTGTSGKTTTASLAASMLKSQGYTVFLGGNIGTPLSEYILDSRKANVIVVEISSFQLQGCNTFCPRAAILLNISPNHLDYHKDMSEYLDAKFRIFRCQDDGDLAIIDDNLQAVAKNYSVSCRKVWLNDCGRFKNMRLKGQHNRINAEAAWQAARFFGVSLENAEKAAEQFVPLPHRLEEVRVLNGVEYINDSKCTTPAALKVALEAFDQPIRLLCGGKFKGGDLTLLNNIIREHVAQISLFGASREIFEQAWSDIVPMSWHDNLKDAVLELNDSADPGDVILLAPATSSYDLYHNYQERGNDFKNIVGNLA